MGQRVSVNDFHWMEEPEPHVQRRKEILKKHPEIKQLMGTDRYFKYIALSMVAFQMASWFVVYNLPWPALIILAYVVGGTINHSLMLAIHEIAHNAGFGHMHPLKNKMLGIFCNLPIGIPFSVAFKGYHLEHHKYQGHEILDTDIPTELEAKLFNRTLLKMVWMFFQSLFYMFRPLIMNPKSPSSLEIINTIIQLTFDAFILHYFGGKVLAYMIVGSLIAMGIHPVSGHFISEHYMFKQGYETYSYYGPLNYITFNVGYHNEHHDFPNVPGCNLPKVREMAPEFYNSLPHHDSWTKVLYDFIMDNNVGLYARAKRKQVREHMQLQKSKDS